MSEDDKIKLGLKILFILISYAVIICIIAPLFFIVAKADTIGYSSVKAWDKVNNTWSYTPGSYGMYTDLWVYYEGSNILPNHSVTVLFDVKVYGYRLFDSPSVVPILYYGSNYNQMMTCDSTPVIAYNRYGESNLGFRYRYKCRIDSTVSSNNVAIHYSVTGFDYSTFESASYSFNLDTNNEVINAIQDQTDDINSSISAFEQIVSDSFNGFQPGGVSLYELDHASAIESTEDLGSMNSSVCVGLGCDFDSDILDFNYNANVFSFIFSSITSLINLHDSIMPYIVTILSLLLVARILGRSSD